MDEYENLRCADIVAEALVDWKIDTIFGLPVYSIQRKMLRKDLS
jgi:hypothetical protein